MSSSTSKSEGAAIEVDGCCGTAGGGTNRRTSASNALASNGFSMYSAPGKRVIASVECRLPLNTPLMNTRISFGACTRSDSVAYTLLPSVRSTVMRFTIRPGVPALTSVHVGAGAVPFVVR